MLTKEQMSDLIKEKLMSTDAQGTKLHLAGIFLSIDADHKTFIESMDNLEKELGEEVCNDWLCDVMASAGLYERDADGFVTYKK